MKAHADIPGLVVNTAMYPPKGFSIRNPTDPGSTDPAAPLAYDVISEIWSDSEEAGKALYGALVNQIGGELGQSHAYHVSETVIFDRGMPSVRAAPCVKLIGRLMFHPDLSDSAVKRSWALHGNLAKKVHVGTIRYVQNWVEAALDVTSPQTRGIPELFFLIEKDLVEGFYDSERGYEEIIHDVSHFVQGGPRIISIERVFKAPPNA